MSLAVFLSALGRTSLQAGALVLLILATQWIFRRQLSPRWRCALWLLVVIRLVIPVSVGSVTSLLNLAPALVSPDISASVVSPTIPDKTVADKFDAGVGYPSTQAVKVSVPNASREPETPGISSSAQSSASDNSIILENTVQANAAPREIKPASAVSPAVPIEPARPVQAPFNGLRLIFGLWLAGALTMGCYLLASTMLLARRFRRSREIRDPRLAEMQREAAQSLGVSVSLPIYECDLLGSPALYGCWRPRLLLPTGFTQRFSSAELGYVFLHELAHVKRRDLPLNWLLSLLQVVHWFNPFVWFAFHRWRADREMACDAMVLEAAGPAHNEAYGRTILHILESFVPQALTPGLVGIIEDKRLLRQRISLIATFAPRRQRTLLVVALISGLALVGLTDAQTTAPGAGPVVTQNLTSAQLQLKGQAAADARQWEAALDFYQQALAAASNSPDVLLALGTTEAQLPGRELRAIGWFEAYLALAPDAPKAADARRQIDQLATSAESRANDIITLLQQAAAPLPADGRIHGNLAAERENPTDYVAAKGVLNMVGTILKDAEAAHPAPLPADVPLTPTQRAQLWVDYVQNDLASPLFLNFQSTLDQTRVVTAGAIEPAWTVFSQVRRQADAWIARLGEVRAAFPVQKYAAAVLAERERQPVAVRYPDLAGVLAHVETELGIKLIPVSAAKFTMVDRSPANRSAAVIQVTLTRDYFLGATDVTQGQYEAVMGENPSYFLEAGQNAPVEHVSWYDAMAFCAKLTERERAAGRLPEGYAFMLPTDAQWEYAGRAGAATWPDAGTIATMAWSSENSGHSTHPVGLKQTNAWGFSDMNGNVFQWCFDNYQPIINGDITDPVGSNADSRRIYRGRSWYNPAASPNDMSRGSEGPAFRNGLSGFRIALVVPSAAQLMALDGNSNKGMHFVSGPADGATVALAEAKHIPLGFAPRLRDIDINSLQSKAPLPFYLLDPELIARGGGPDADQPLSYFYRIESGGETVFHVDVRVEASGSSRAVSEGFYIGGANTMIDEGLAYLATLNQVRKGSFEVRLLCDQSLGIPYTELAIWLKSDVWGADLVYTLDSVPHLYSGELTNAVAIEAKKLFSINEYMDAYRKYQRNRLSFPTGPLDWNSTDEMNAYFVKQFVAGAGRGISRMPSPTMAVDNLMRLTIHQTLDGFTLLGGNGLTYKPASVDLIGIAKHDPPVAFISPYHSPAGGSPDVKTRALTDAEKKAIEDLRAGKETAALRGPDGKQMVIGAIRARESCLDCHVGAKTGDLLGALSYRLYLQN